MVGVVVLTTGRTLKPASLAATSPLPSPLPSIALAITIATAIAVAVAIAIAIAITNAIATAIATAIAIAIVGCRHRPLPPPPPPPSHPHLLQHVGLDAVAQIVRGIERVNNITPFLPQRKGRAVQLARLRKRPFPRHRAEV